MEQGNIINRLIGQAAKGYTDYKVEPIVIQVEKDEVKVTRPAILSEVAELPSWDFNKVGKTLELGNDILILTSPDVDIPITATLSLESQDNLFKTTRPEYLNTHYNKHQMFKGFLKAELKNYGGFVPFQLEFLRITPTL